MEIGTKIKYSYTDTNGNRQQGTGILSSNILDESVLSDDQVVARFAEELQKFPRKMLKASGFILAARFVLKKDPNATNILVDEDNGKSGGDAGGAVFILAVLAFIVAVFVFPLLVILGMHNKLFLKGFYNKYDSEEYKDFIKKYTYIGIGLYALVAVMIILDKVTKLALFGPAFSILLFGGIAYFVISLLWIKKKYAPEGEKLNIVETLKDSFKKKETK